MNGNTTIRWASILVAAVGSLGVAVAESEVCCTTTFSLTNQSDPPYGQCSAGTIVVCELSVILTDPGQIRNQSPRDPLCSTYTPNSTEVTTSPCDTPPGSGWWSIGSMGGDPEQCCWVTMAVAIAAWPPVPTQTGYVVFPCDGDDCP